MTIIEQYEQLHKHITERAIYVNDMLAKIDVAEHLQEYLPEYCGVPSSIVDLRVSCDTIMLSYVDCDNYTSNWYVDAAYIDMSDEDIKAHHLNLIQHKHEISVAHKLRNLKEGAKMFGYKLVKEGE